MKKIKNKKSQEEMVGFVLIVLLVTIVAFIFLIINIRKPPQKLPSNEVESFMQSAMKYSTDCYSSVERRYDVRDLIKACSNNELCLNKKTSCNILNQTLSGILEESWNPGKENPIKAYNLKIYDKNTNKTIINLKEGICSGSRVGSSIPIPGGLVSELDICG